MEVEVEDEGGDVSEADVGDVGNAEEGACEVEVEVSEPPPAGVEPSPSAVEVATCSDSDSVAVVVLAPLSCGEDATTAPASKSTDTTQASLLAGSALLTEAIRLRRARSSSVLS